MPWTCNCKEETLDDTKTCPVCGMTKAEWSVKFDKTRNFVIPVRRRRKKKASWIEVQALDPEGHPLEGEAAWIRLPSGQIRKGSLDAKGSLKLTHVPGGACEIRFPHYFAHDFASHERQEVGEDEPLELHPLEIELLDPEGRPLAGIDYWAQLPGEDAPRQGRLDAQGRVRLLAKQAGECELRFPSFFAHDLEPSSRPLRPHQNKEELEEEPEASEWVALELQDPQGKPLAGHPYRLFLPGQQEPRRGRLDAEGKAWVPAEQAGTCRIEFEGLYAHDLERVEP